MHPRRRAPPGWGPPAKCICYFLSTRINRPMFPPTIRPISSLARKARLTLPSSQGKGKDEGKGKGHQ